MDVRTGRLWLWLVLLASSLAGLTTGKGGGGVIPLHVNAVYPPPPCYPVTKHINKDKFLTNYVTIYSTLVQPVVVPTTFYHTSYLTSYNNITKFIYSTAYDEEIEYDSSVAVGTDYISVTDIVAVPEVTTVTDIRLKVVPSVVTSIKGVTVGSAEIIADTTFFTRTWTVDPTVTVTQTQPFPVVTTRYTVVTETQVLSETVTVTAPAVKGPQVTSTILNTEVVFTPAYVTQTIFNTVAATVTEHEQVPYTVTVQAPCGVGVQGPGGHGSGVPAAIGDLDIRGGAGNAAVYVQASPGLTSHQTPGSTRY